MSQFPQPNQEFAQLDPAALAASQIATQLRAEFDQTFALPLRPPAAGARDFVVLQVAGQRYALAAQSLRAIERTASRDADSEHAASPRFAPDDALAYTTSLEGGRSSAMEWVRVPSTQPALLGIRTFSGRIVPVFRLAAMLGLRSSTEPTHCALVAVGQDLVGFAFDALLRFARIEADQIFAPGAAAQSWEEATLSDAGEVFAVIGMPALLRLLAPSSSHAEARENPSLQIGKS